MGFKGQTPVHFKTFDTFCKTSPEMLHQLIYLKKCLFLHIILSPLLVLIIFVNILGDTG